jgi:hypothetical protein
MPLTHGELFFISPTHAGASRRKQIRTGLPGKARRDASGDQRQILLQEPVVEVLATDQLTDLSVERNRFLADATGD